MRYLCAGLLALALMPVAAEAGHRDRVTSWGFSIGIGGGYARPYCPPPAPVYYPPPPVVYQPAPVYCPPPPPVVVYQPAPVYVPPPPVVVYEQPRYYYGAPVYQPAPVYSGFSYSRTEYRYGR